MRLDTDVVFVKNGSEEYDPIKGETITSDQVETTISANVTDLGTERSMKLFGDVNEQRLVIRLLEPYTEPFDYIRINSKTYKQTTVREPSMRSSMIVDEVSL